MRLIDAHDIEYEHICGEFRVSEEKINAMPTVCDIEQIRAEIERLHYHPKLDFIKNDDVVKMALEIIDKYKAESEE